MIFITDEGQLKEACSGVSVDFTIESLKSFIDDAELMLLMIVGENSTAQIIGDDKAWKAMRRAVVNLALDGYASTGAVMISDTGIHVYKSQTLLPASDKKLLSFRRDAKERGWLAFEQLIVIMEARKSVFTVWAESTERLNYLDTLFFTSGEFGNFTGVSISAHLFQVIKKQVAFVETDYLDVHFGAELVAQIRSKQLGGNMNTEEKKLLRYFLRIVGPLAVAEAIPYRAVQISENGVYQSSVSTFGTNSDNIEGLTVVQQRVMNSLMVKLTSEGEAMIVQTKKWLNANKALFPAYGEEKKVYPMEDFNDRDSNVFLA